jgi:hypothetical protein
MVMPRIATYGEAVAMVPGSEVKFVFACVAFSATTVLKTFPRRVR